MLQAATFFASPAGSFLWGKLCLKVLEGRIVCKFFTKITSKEQGASSRGRYHVVNEPTGVQEVILLSASAVIHPRDEVRCRPYRNGKD